MVDLLNELKTLNKNNNVGDGFYFLNVDGENFSDCYCFIILSEVDMDEQYHDEITQANCEYLMCDVSISLCNHTGYTDIDFSSFRPYNSPELLCEAIKKLKSFQSGRKINCP